MMNFPIQTRDYCNNKISNVTNFKFTNIPCSCWRVEGCSVLGKELMTVPGRHQVFIYRLKLKVYNTYILGTGPSLICVTLVGKKRSAWHPRLALGLDRRVISLFCPCKSSSRVLHEFAYSGASSPYETLSLFFYLFLHVYWLLPNVFNGP